MKADQIIRNAKIFTSNPDAPQATALAVKDGKFVYVGDEAGLSAYEGEVTDLGGKFIMPGIIDSHVHVTMGAAFEYTDMGTPIQCDGKKEALDYMANYIRLNPGLKCYRFVLERKFLKGEEITRKDLDTICPDSDLLIMEGEAHSVWVNSSFLKRLDVTDDTPDPVPGLSYFVRKDGHVTGNIFETAEMRFLLDGTMELTDAQLDAALTRWINYSVANGVVGVFDAGIPECNPLHERIYARLRELDRQGKLPVYIDGCYVITAPRQVPEALEELKRFRREFDTEHLKVHTLKIFNDGTLKIETAALVTPYHYGAQDHGELKNLLKRSLTIIGVTSAMMFVLSEVIARPFSALFLQDASALLPDAVHAFRIISAAYLFTGMAVFGSAFFTALNNGQVSALISFLRTFVFELVAVLMLPMLLGVDGIWYSSVFAELMAAATGSIFMSALRGKYHY